MQRTHLALLSLLVSFSLACDKTGQQTATDELKPLVEQLQSTDSNQRIDAFYRIVGLGAQGTAVASNPLLDVHVAIQRALLQDPALALALIRTLKTENGFVRQQKELDERFSSYYGDLLVAVTGLHDPRAIGDLVNAMDTGNLVLNALVAFGTPAVGPVMDRLKQGVSARSGCVVLGRMLELENPSHIQDGKVRKQIEDSLVTATQNSPAFVKISAFEAMAKSTNAAIRQASLDGLQSLARRTDNNAVSAAASHSLNVVKSDLLRRLEDLRRANPANQQ